MKRGFQRTSALPACSKTSEFSASTECVKKKNVDGGKNNTPNMIQNF